jgi:hypothetical protein
MWCRGVSHSGRKCEYRVVDMNVVLCGNPVIRRKSLYVLKVLYAVVPSLDSDRQPSLFDPFESFWLANKKIFVIY